VRSCPSQLMPGGGLSAAQALGDGNTVWNDPSVLGPFGLWFNQAYESSTIRFSVSKTGTDGWNFNVIVVGIDQAGNRRQLLRAEGLHFQHGLETASWVLSG
jgi:hypothetical protein